jgi:hypothetical protein
MKAPSRPDEGLEPARWTGAGEEEAGDDVGPLKFSLRALVCVRYRSMCAGSNERQSSDVATGS